MAGLVYWDVDTQNDFMLADGRLYVPDAESIIANLQRLTEHARAKGIRIVASADDHTAEDAEIADEPDFTVTFPPHCMRGTEGQKRIQETTPLNPLIVDPQPREPAELIEVVRAHPGEIVLHKQTVRVFDNPNTATVVDALDPDAVFVYGVALDICNRHAVEGLQAYRPDTAISVILDASKPIDAATADALLERWETQGVELISTDDAVQYGTGVEVEGATTT